MSALFAPLNWIYRNVYIPHHLWVANALGGTTFAGTWGRRSRMLRLAGNTISLGAIGATIAQQGFAAFWAAGSVLPFMTFQFVCLGMLLNSIGWYLGVGANHLKVEQYYNSRLELHAANNALRAPGNKLPLERSGLLFATNLLRGLHDMNGMGGTVLSVITSLPTALAIVSIGIYTLNPALGSLLFFISRASAAASAICVWGTNQLRLWAHKKLLDDQIQSFYYLKSQDNPARHEAIFRTVNKAFSNLQINQDHKYSSWVFLRCYKALDSYMSPRAIGQDLTHILHKILSPFLNPIKKIFDREKIIQMHHLPVLETMPLLESHIFKAISLEVDPGEYKTISRPIDRFLKKTMENPRSPTINLLAYHLKRRQHQAPKGMLSPAALNATLEKGSEEKFQINKEATLKQYPVEGTPHGAPFLPDYLMDQIAKDTIRPQI